MSAGRRRMWWRHIKTREELGMKVEEIVETDTEETEEEDGRFKSEGSEGRVHSS
tara:strand:+ start:133 stop:294 length:162 start_codon:yes stop_codon:yes gene_type:complete